MADYCIICGARLSDNNTTGIGCECLAALYAAKTYRAKKEGLSLKLYIKEVEIVKENFVRILAGTKFRSEFKKSFYSSIVSAERISKKQLDIMYNMIDEKMRTNFYLYDEVRKKVDEYERSIIESTEVGRDEIEMARQFIRANK